MISKTFATLLLLLFSLPASATHFGIVGNGTWSAPRSGDSDYSFSGNAIGLGGGFTFEMGSGLIGAEIGAMFMSRSTELNYKKDHLILGTSYKVQVRTVFEQAYAHFPLLFRLKFFNDVFSIGIGGYFNHCVGPLRVSETEYYLNGSKLEEKTPPKLNRLIKERGFLASLRLLIPVRRIHLLIDGRYLYGTSRILEEGSPKASDIQGLIGIAFKFGGR